MIEQYFTLRIIVVIVVLVIAAAYVGYELWRWFH